MREKWYFYRVRWSSADSLHGYAWRCTVRKRLLSKLKYLFLQMHGFHGKKIGGYRYATIAIAAAAGIVYWLKLIHPFESTDNTYLKAHMSLISPRETGYVKEVLFEDNQKVMPGDPLVVIDDHDFQAKVAQAEAQVLMETARIHTLETNKRTQSAKIRQEEANIAAAEADLERAAKDLKRFGNLAADGAVSAQTRDSAESAHKQESAQREKIRSARQEAESELASLDAQIGETRARLKAAQAALWSRGSFSSYRRSSPAPWPKSWIRA